MSQAPVYDLSLVQLVWLTSWQITLSKHPALLILPTEVSFINSLLPTGLGGHIELDTPVSLLCGNRVPFASSSSLAPNCTLQFSQMGLLLFCKWAFVHTASSPHLSNWNAQSCIYCCQNSMLPLRPSLLSLDSSVSVLFWSPIIILYLNCST